LQSLSSDEPRSAVANRRGFLCGLTQLTSPFSYRMRS